jgi:UDP-GlcNAc3NAcA epimerase
MNMPPKALRIVSIVGARPQFIKAAAISRAIDSHNSGEDSQKITEVLVHTGQHYDYNMSQVFFDELKIPEPGYHLDVGSAKHGEMTGKMLSRIESVLLEERPDWVLVYGDTNSTLAGALAAVKLHIPVAHVEAGLRSFNRLMPEEINRVVTDHISNLLFCPTNTAVRNLENEGITEGVSLVGDVMYDSFFFNRKLSQSKSNILSELGLEAGSYCLGTVHRQENTDDPQKLLDIFNAFEKLARTDCPFIILLHPRTKNALLKHKGKNRPNPALRLLPPATYLDTIALTIHSKVILTDSGGLQKEAFFSRVPCVTLRDETEWIETVEAGWNFIAGTNATWIVKTFHKVLEANPDGSPELYGKGNASQLIVRRLTSASGH